MCECVAPTTLRRECVSESVMSQHVIVCVCDSVCVCVYVLCSVYVSDSKKHVSLKMEKMELQ